jgi:uncharacterized protein (DUF1501 family)
MDRRQFLSAGSSLALASMLGACADPAKGPVTGAAQSTGAAQAPRAAVPRSAGVAGAVNQRILLLVELHGGNDGINTVIPINQPAYKALRPGLAIDRAQALDIDRGFALHPALKPIAEIYDRGELAIVNAVGYPKPNRSHFRSIEIWEQATSSDQYGSEGWVTHALRDHPVWSKRSGDADALAIGQGNIGPLAGNDLRLVTMRDPRQFLAQSERLRALPANAAPTAALAHVVRTQNEAVAAADAVRRKQTGRDRFTRAFPGDQFNRALATTADLIADGVDVPVWKVQLPGFDTHADQLGRHQRLMNQLAQGLSGFRKSMIDLGRWNDVLVVTYSEFGRRAAENLSRGTDHGAAAPLFAMGGSVEGGFKGTPPDLEKLVEGDIDATIDFRQIYAGIVADWWSQPDNFLAKQGHTPVRLARTRTGAGPQNAV